MVFKRRKPRTYVEVVSESIYPRGGWRRAVRYVAHRLQRLPDPAHKISRGIAAGVFASFSPLFGMHFVIATLVALALRGNVVAALMGTFIGNPVTFPLIAAVSMELGSWMLGQSSLPLPLVLNAFTDASIDLWRNLIATFSGGPVHWGGLDVFWDQVFLPYLVGGLIPGFAAAVATYVLANPIIATYQKARVARLKKRFAKKRERVMSRRLSAPAE
ncbi:DUF2062 domain-containing protein [Rhodobacteraceae bacterium]|nr:DUF2062 domain-containing protein [Paracoccaceae bacterium]